MLNSRFPSVFGDTPDATGLSLDEGETLYVPLRPRRARLQQTGLVGAVTGGAQRNCPRNSVYLLYVPRFWPGKHQVEHLRHCPEGVMGGLHMGWVLLHVGLPTSLGALSSSLGPLSWWEQSQVYPIKN